VGIFKRKMSRQALLDRRTDLMASQASIDAQLAELREQQSAALAQGEDPVELETRIVSLGERFSGLGQAIKAVDAEIAELDRAAAERQRQANWKAAKEARLVQQKAAEEVDRLLALLGPAFGEFQSASSAYQSALRTADPALRPTPDLRSLRGFVAAAIWKAAPELASLLRLDRGGHASRQVSTLGLAERCADTLAEEPPARGEESPTPRRGKLLSEPGIPNPEALKELGQLAGEADRADAEARRRCEVEKRARREGFAIGPVDDSGVTEVTG